MREPQDNLSDFYDVKNRPPPENLHICFRWLVGKRPGLKERARKEGCLRAAILQVHNAWITPGMGKSPIISGIDTGVDTIFPPEKVTFVLFPNGAFYGVFGIQASGSSSLQREISIRCGAFFQ